MSALAIMGLLGLTLLLPIFLSDDDDDGVIEDPVQPVEPTDTTDAITPEVPETPDGGEQAPTIDEDTVLNGTAGDDILRATTETPNVNGNDGNDTLVSGIDGLPAQLNGGNGDDVIETEILVGFPDLTTGSQILTGGAGTDSFVIDLDPTSVSETPVDFPLAIITDFTPGSDSLLLRVSGSPFGGQQFQDVTQTLAEDGSYTDLVTRYSDSDGIDPDLTAVVRLEGVAGLAADQFTVEDGRDVINGTEGNDTLSSSGNDNDRFDGRDTVRGLAGDDVLVHSGSDSGAPLVLEGGDGNDTLMPTRSNFATPLHSTAALAMMSCAAISLWAVAALV